MNDEARLLFSLWESVGEFVPASDKQEAAAQMIRSLIEIGGHDFDLLHDAEGECPYLDKAITEIAAEIAEEEDEVEYEDED